MIPPFPSEFSPLRLAANALGRRDCEVKRGSHFIGIFSNNAAFVRLVRTLLLDRLIRHSQALSLNRGIAATFILRLWGSTVI